MARLIITNGDSAVERLKAGGIAGHLLPWRDMLHDGPVPDSPSLAQVADTRAEFLSDALGLEFDSVRADFAERDAQLEIHIAFREVQLWFEHDLFDQLQLIQLLHFFALEPERLGVQIVQAHDYIGTLEVGHIRALAETASPVTALQLEAGRTAWEAFTAPTPKALAALASRDQTALPHLAPALRRALAELPAPRSGLSLTEERILRRLAETGPQKVHQVFSAVHKMDEAQFLADLPFFLRLDGLAFVREPLIEGLPFRASDCKSFDPSREDPSPEEISYRTFARAEITLTPAGEAALKGKLDHACENGIERWLGGTHIHSGAMWRYDRAKSRLVEPN
ncbi:hypothetical protein GCM10007301_49050 [Azorhizobium oxalatiphilum]|uniref:DUF1835 domain-containing protein n=1 Tax=Azorhizobium oxalatiphilum TaxID=980631 RepID=A0A917FGG9_9HYPH|nr:hypothetical protein [Azorhizobium oxalatiphilum]GGF83115.1 hypothetical protein GCM10007301_49050 [Azorhizobium oxalatiphilum]